MKIPNLQGHWDPTQLETITQLLIEMQNNLSDEGFRIPHQKTDNIEKINNISNKASIGSIIYDSETHQLKANINGVVKVIQTL